MPVRVTVKAQRRTFESDADVWGSQYSYIKKFAITMAAAVLMLTAIELLFASFACSQMCAVRKLHANMKAAKSREMGYGSNSHDEVHSVQKEEFDRVIPSVDGDAMEIYDCEGNPDHKEQPVFTPSEVIGACDALDGVEITTNETEENATMIQQVSGFLERLYQTYALRYDFEDKPDDIGADRVIVLNNLQFAAAKAS